MAHEMPRVGSRDATRTGARTTDVAAQHLRGASGLDHAAKAWERIDEALSLPMAHYAFIKSIVSAFGMDERLHIFMVGPEGGVRAIAALTRSSRLMSPLSIPGIDELGEPMDFAFTDPAALSSLCRAIARTPFPLYLSRLPADSPTVGALRRAYAGRGFVVCRPALPYPFITLDASWVDPEDHLSARRRSDLRRARRHAERLGALSYSVVAPRPADLEPLLDEAFRVEASSWKGRAGTALACGTAVGSFFRKYAAEASSRGILRIFALRVGGRAAAMQIAVQHGGRYWLLKVGYDEAFALASPGLLLLCESLRYAASEGLASYEFLGAVAPWVKPWTQQERACISVRVYPLSLLGIATLSSRALARAARGSRIEGGICMESRKIKDAALSLWEPLARRASRAYAAGPLVSDALRATRALSRARVGAIICYWNKAADPPALVAARSLDALLACAREIADFHLSLKAPALDYSEDLVAEIAARAAELKVRVHFDAQRPLSVAKTLALAERALAFPARIGVTLPGRFPRSVADAAWAIARGVAVRVVKGQIADPAAPDVDPRRGLLAVIHALAGSTIQVGVASHDAPLVREALSRLVTAGTPCELELLYGLPFEPALAEARALGVPVRVYVPFGDPRLPYHLSDARKNPRIFSWLLRDLGRVPRREVARLERLS